MEARMSRVEQPSGQRGSLKWIQQGVNLNSAALSALILPKLAGAKTINWRSPLAGYQYSEYRDGEFLVQIGADQLVSELERFWPSRGPQWDALAQCDDGSVLLVEAKAHIGELCTTPSQAGVESLEKIEAALDETASFIGAKPRAPWSSVFYQLANRIAHLHFLRKHGIKAWLVLVSFVGDTEMKGPFGQAEWEAAYQVVWHVLGIPKRHKLSAYIVEVFPDVRTWNSSGSGC
jgi:hypothetical protein